MKEFMFAAIALVAFSGASFANNGEVVEIKKLPTPPDPCIAIGFAASNAVYAAGGTPEEATAAAEGAYNQCKKSISTD